MSAQELGEIGPILGSTECTHETVIYYDGVEGIYAVCRACGGHFWGPTVPDGAEVIDLMSWDDDTTECSHGVALEAECRECAALTERARAYGFMPQVKEQGGEA